MAKGPLDITNPPNGDFSGGGNGAVADGSNVVEGSTNDAAASAGGVGTLSAKLRRISADIASLLTGGVLSGTKEVTGSASSLTTVIPSTDVSLYSWLSIQVTGTWQGVLAFQVSNDNTNWVNVGLVRTTETGGLITQILGNTTSANFIYAGAINAKYFRFVFTSYTSGTCSAVAEFSAAPKATQGMAVSGNVNVNGTPAVSTVSVGTSSTSVLSSNGNRKAVIFANTGANTIYLNLAGGTAVATNTPLDAGEKFIWDRWVTTGAITGIAATSATNLSITELT